MFIFSMRKSFKDSLKVLEADIQHANTLYVCLPLFVFVCVFFGRGVFTWDIGEGFVCLLWFC